MWTGLVKYSKLPPNSENLDKGGDGQEVKNNQTIIEIIGIWDGGWSGKLVLEAYYEILEAFVRIREKNDTLKKMRSRHSRIYHDKTE